MWRDDPYLRVVGVAGPPGPAGANGPQGAMGPQGPTGRSQRSEAPVDVVPVAVSWQSAEDISFEADEADIMPRCAKRIELLAACGRTHPMFDVALDARADEALTGETDPQLGERRVGAVRAAPVAAGVTQARIHAATLSDRRGSCALGTSTCL
jgi:outer membrane protein OmpA-like peptidoglycan-associated protein